MSIREPYRRKGGGVPSTIFGAEITIYKKQDMQKLMALQDRMERL